jgi:hypothetical protein
VELRRWDCFDPGAQLVLLVEKVADVAFGVLELG